MSRTLGQLGHWDLVTSMLQFSHLSLPNSHLCKLGHSQQILTEGYCARAFSSSSCVLWCPDQANQETAPGDVSQSFLLVTACALSALMGRENETQDARSTAETSGTGCCLQDTSTSLYVSWLIATCERLL